MLSAGMTTQVEAKLRSMNGALCGIKGYRYLPSQFRRTRISVTAFENATFSEFAKPIEKSGASIQRLNPRNPLNHELRACVGEFDSGIDY